ncbi:MAG: shikimate kinase [Bacteroidetes bacterium]|nr:shikimate kinase [Bacteroidota bacterium]
MLYRIFLIGLMGSGKTFWSEKIYQQSGIPAYDLDKEIELSEGKTIASIFTEKGEAYFRQKENEVLKSFACKNNFILSTGGGAPCYFDNMDWMNRAGVTIWIDEPINIIVERLKPEKSQRPLIAQVKDEDLPIFFSDMRNNRKQFYSKAKYHLTGKISLENFLEIISPNE